MAIENAPHPGAFVEPTASNLRDTAIPMFENLLRGIADQPIPYRLTWTPYPNIVLWPGAGQAPRIWLRSGDRPESLKGLNLAWAGVDEIARIKQSIWGILTSRVRIPEAKHKQAFATGTPDDYWVAEIWEENPPEGYELYRASTLENLALGDDDIQAIYDSHGADDLLWAIEGKFVRGGRGRVYKAFDRSIHIRNTSPFDPQEQRDLLPGIPLSLACDFNIDPCVWLVCQVRGDAVYVADEIALEDTDTPSMIEEFRQRYGKWWGQVAIYGDAAGKYRSGPSASKSDYELMRRAGLRHIRVPDANPPVKDRIAAVNARLLSGNNKVRLYVHERCQGLIKDFEWVVWKAGTADIDKRDRQLTHAGDALGYLIHRLFPVRRPAPRPRRAADFKGRG